MRKARPLTRDGRIVGACIVLIVVAALGSISNPADEKHERKLDSSFRATRGRDRLPCKSARAGEGNRTLTVLRTLSPGMPLQVTSSAAFDSACR